MIKYLDFISLLEDLSDNQINKYGSIIKNRPDFVIKELKNIFGNSDRITIKFQNNWITITSNPYDLALMSNDQLWRSCKSSDEKNKYQVDKSEYIDDEIKYGLLCCYLHTKEVNVLKNKEQVNNKNYTFNCSNTIARINLIPYFDDENNPTEIFYKLGNRIYKSPNDDSSYTGFRNKLIEFVNNINKNKNKEKYYLSYDIYNDDGERYTKNYDLVFKNNKTDEIYSNDIYNYLFDDVNYLSNKLEMLINYYKIDLSIHSNIVENVAKFAKDNKTVNLIINNNIKINYKFISNLVNNNDNISNKFIKLLIQKLLKEGYNIKDLDNNKSFILSWYYKRSYNHEIVGDLDYFMKLGFQLDLDDTRFILTKLLELYKIDNNINTFNMIIRFLKIGNIINSKLVNIIINNEKFESIYNKIKNYEKVKEYVSKELEYHISNDLIITKYVIDFILKLGFDINHKFYYTKEEYGYDTLLSIYIKFNSDHYNYETFKYLIDKGSDIFIKNSDGYSSLDLIVNNREENSGEQLKYIINKIDKQTIIQIDYGYEFDNISILLKNNNIKFHINIKDKVKMSEFIFIKLLAYPKQFNLLLERVDNLNELKSSIVEINLNHISYAYGYLCNNVSIILDITHKYFNDILVIMMFYIIHYEENCKFNVGDIMYEKLSILQIVDDINQFTKFIIYLVDGIQNAKEINKYESNLIKKMIDNKIDFKSKIDKNKIDLLSKLNNIKINSKVLNDWKSWIKN